MPNNITGVGVLGLRDPINNILYLTPATTMTVNQERTVEVVQGYSQTDCTELLDQDAAGKSSQITITLGTGILDEETWSWIVFNNRQQTSLSIDLPRFVSGTVGDTGEITVTGLAADNETVSVVILDNEVPGNIGLTPNGIAGLGFTVGAGIVTVDDSFAGKTAVVYYKTTGTNIKMIGGNTVFRPYENIECFGKFCGTRFAPKRLWFPSVTSITGFSIDPSADTFSREFRAFLPPGWNQPYAFFNA